MSRYPQRITRAAALFCTAALLGLGPVAVCAAQTDPDAPSSRPELGASERGITVRWGQTDFIVDTAPTALMAKVQDKTINPENNRWDFQFTNAAVDDAKVQVDAEQQRVTQTYAWGQLRSTYTLEGNRLNVALQIDNRGKRPLANFKIRLMTLNLPNKPAALAEGLINTLDRPVAVELVTPQGKAFVSYETFDPPLHLRIEPGNDGGYAVSIAGGVRILPKGEVAAPPMGLPFIPPGQTLKLSFAIRFAGAQARREQVLADFYQSFRQYQSPMLNWPDRRPIGAAFLMNEVGKKPTAFGQEGTNPRRWFSPQMDTVEMDSPHGRAMLRQALQNLAYNTVRSLKRMNGQGIILWNAEGGFHETGWVGDPRMLPILSPELDDAIDDYFRIIRQAGFKTGLTIRHGQLRWNQDRANWSQGVGNHNPSANPALDEFDKYLEANPHRPWWEIYPIAQRMSAKIAYAKKRWGCEIFYIDTNMVLAGWAGQKGMKARLIETHIWRQVREDHPDVLIIPEISGRPGHPYVAYVAHMAPYGQLGYGRVREKMGPDYTHDILPDYFGMHYISDGEMWNSRTHRVREVARGLIFIAQGWSWSTTSEATIEFYNQARAHQQRATTLGRRFVKIDNPGDARPLFESVANARPIHPDRIVSNPPAAERIRLRTASDADGRQAMLTAIWHGNPHSPPMNLKPDLPGVDLAGPHKLAFDIASGDLISDSQAVRVPAAPITGFRPMLVRSSDTPPPGPRPHGLRLALSFDRGLAPDLGGGLLADHGDAPRTDSPHGKALKLSPGGGIAQYGVVPNWFAGTLEFNLRAHASGKGSLPLVRFQHHMQTALTLTRVDGKPVLQLDTYERDVQKMYWRDEGLAPAPDASTPPSLRQLNIPLPDDDKWHHVVLVWDTGQYVVYIDGQQAGMLAKPAMYRWRDGTILQPGLVFGGGEKIDTPITAQIDSAMLYNWNFDHEQAAGRRKVVAIDPLVRPEDAAPSIWIWGKDAKTTKYAAVNLRRWPGGESAHGVKVELFEKLAGGGMQKLSEGSASPCRGVAVMQLEYEPEAPPAQNMPLQSDDGPDLGDLGKAVQTFVLKVTGRQPGEDPPVRQIEFQYDPAAGQTQRW